MRQKVSITSPIDMFDVQITQRQDEAEDIISLELRACGDTALPRFEAGAHIDIEVHPGCVRQYSLFNDPGNTGAYKLGILKEVASRGGSSGIHETFAIGQRVRISPPRNTFSLVLDATRTVLVAGGIGITPLLSMAYSLHAAGKAFKLHYCCRTRNKAAFLNLLAQAPFASQVHLHTDDGAEAQRLTPDRDLDHIEGSHLFVCGPEGFANFILDSGKAQGWPDSSLHVERFSAHVDITGDTFELRAARSGLTLIVPKDKSIAQVLLDAGVNVSLSCEQGVCGTCITRVLSGQADHRDMILTDEEKAQGDMTVCCSRALTPVLTLDI